MNIFYYPWGGFKNEFLAKDVGLFPSYSSIEDEVMLLQYSEKLNYRHRNILVDSISSFYFLGLIKLFYCVLKNNPKIFYTFHIGLKNFIPIFLIKTLLPDCRIICKGDVNKETAEYLVNKPSRLLDRIRIYSYYKSFSKTDLITVETSEVFELLSPIFQDRGLDNLKLLPNGIDDLEFENLELPNLKSNIITVVTRFGCKHKAPERVYSIIESLKGIDIQLVLVGEIPSEDRDLILLTAQKYGVSVDIKGILARKEILDLLSKSKFFFCYSKLESFCISLIEAAALGNIVITTKVGVAKDLASHYKYIHVLDEFDATRFREILLNYYVSSIDDEVCKNAGIIQDQYFWSKLIEDISQ